METPVLLLVEDEVLMQELLATEFADAGFEIIVASDGNRALVELDADASRFKAVVTDIKLGEGPDGWDVARRAREQLSAAVATLITAVDTHRAR